MIILVASWVYCAVMSLVVIVNLLMLNKSISRFLFWHFGSKMRRVDEILVCLSIATACIVSLGVVWS